jgi:hypothetical protein
MPVAEGYFVDSFEVDSERFGVPADGNSFAAVKKNALAVGFYQYAQAPFGQEVELAGGVFAQCGYTQWYQTPPSKRSTGFSPLL